MVLLLNSQPSQEPNQPEDNQALSPTDTPPQAKSIDGVKPVPKLSGENQEHHLGETSAPQKPAQKAAQNAVETKQKNPPPKPKPPDNNNFPFVAVLLAVIAAASLTGLAVYLQLNAS
jgi:hypothetical protein